MESFKNYVKENVEFLQQQKVQGEEEEQEILNNSKKKNKSKHENVVPELLLSYTYFLNAEHTSYISVGLDTNNFKMKIILFKNGIYHNLQWEDWSLLYVNINVIQNHFNGYGVDFLELPKTPSDIIHYKLSSRITEKCLILTGDNKKVVIKLKEWMSLYNLMPFINSIVTWYIHTAHDVEIFYHQYLLKCIEVKSFKLEAQHFFIPSTSATYYQCNYSRLYQEIPLLCQNKIIIDLNQILCKNY